MVSCRMWKMIIIVYNLLSPVTALPTPSAGYYYDTTTIDYDVADFDEFGIEPGITDNPNYENTPGNQDSQPVDAAYDYNIGFGAGTGPDYLGPPGPPFDGAVDNSVIDGVNPIPTPGVARAMSEEGDDGPNGVQSPDDNYYNDNADENASPDENTTQYPDLVDYTTGSSIVEKESNFDNARTEGSTSANTNMDETSSKSGYATPMYTTNAFDIHSGNNGDIGTSNDVNINTTNVSGKIKLEESNPAHSASDKIENQNEVNGTAASKVGQITLGENTEISSVDIQDGKHNSDSIELGSNSVASNENTSSVESYNSAESPEDTSNSLDSLGSDSLEITVLNDSVSNIGSNSLREDQESVNSSSESRESKENIILSKENTISSESNGIDSIENGDNNSDSSQSSEGSSKGSKSSQSNSNESAKNGSDSTESIADSSIRVTDESKSSSSSTASTETSFTSSNVDSSSSESVSKDSGLGDSETISLVEDTALSDSVQSDESTDSNKSETVDNSAKSTSKSTESVSSDSSSLSSASMESRSQSSEAEGSIEHCFQESDSHHDLCALVRSIKMVCVVHFPKDCFLKQSFPWSTELDLKDNSSTSTEDSRVGSKSGSKSDSFSKAFSEETFELESLSASFENVGGMAELMSLIRNSCPIICHASDKVAREMNSVDTDGDSDESDDVDDDEDDDIDDDDDDSTEYDDENDTEDYDSVETEPNGYSTEEYEDSLDGKSGFESVDSEDDFSNIEKKKDGSDSEESLNVSVSENSEDRANSYSSMSSTEMSTDNESNREESRSIVTYSSMESPDNTNSISDAVSDEDN